MKHYRILLFALFCILSNTLSAQNLKEEQVYVQVDKMPQFRDGQVDLVKYLSKNIRYPEQAKKDSLKGNVLVEFIVTADGKVSNVNIKKSLNSECDKEALRVIKAMPNWIPGEKNGKKVAVLMNLPINFE